MEQHSIDRQLRWVEASDGYRLATLHYPAVGQPIGSVVCLHGIQSHALWYEATSRQLAAAGFDVYFTDRRGSGQNGTQRGHAMHADRLINDVCHVLRLARHETKFVPSLLGLSWGGKLATAVAAKRGTLFSNLSLLYPGLRAKIAPTWFQRRLLNLATRAGKHTRRVPIPLSDPSLFTNDRDWQSFIRDDHLTLRHASVAFLQASLWLDEVVNQQATNVSNPLLVLLAGQDQIIDNEATRKLIRQFASADRTIREYVDACHTLEFESNQSAIAEELINWLRQRTSPWDPTSF